MLHVVTYADVQWDCDGKTCDDQISVWRPASEIHTTPSSPGILFSKWNITFWATLVQNFYSVQQKENYFGVAELIYQLKQKHSSWHPSQTTNSRTYKTFFGWEIDTKRTYNSAYDFNLKMAFRQVAVHTNTQVQHLLRWTELTHQQSAVSRGKHISLLTRLRDFQTVTAGMARPYQLCFVS